MHDRSAPQILIDCDGVLVDNVSFDRSVTKSLISSLARARNIVVNSAERLWANELSVTKGHVEWYDYGFHCERLGLARNLVAKAHQESASLLRPVPGARRTLRVARDLGIDLTVVTDATSWVVRFKLDALRWGLDLTAYSSTEAKSTKATETYWVTLSKLLDVSNPVAIIDNRAMNLSSASSVFPLVQPIQFVRSEHVTTLATAYAPSSAGRNSGDLIVVNNHAELQGWLATSYPAAANL